MLGGTVKENGPQGAFAEQLVGGLSSTYTTALPPTVGDDDYAVELAELYWASLLRDVPFTQFVAGTNNPIMNAAVANLNANLAHYRGPVDPVMKKVTPPLLFRGGLSANKRRKTATQTDPATYFADEIAGPYISQLCFWPTNLGAQQIDQSMQTFMPGQDFMTDQNEWFGVPRRASPD